MSDSSNVDDALVTLLMNDSSLAALMPDGVFFDFGKHGAQRFVVVKQLAHEDIGMFGGTAYESFTYLVKAVAFSKSGGDVIAAASRIQTLLQNGTLAPTGYSLMRMQRLERVRYADPDGDERWQHRGGQYAVWVSPN